MSLESTPSEAFLGNDVSEDDFASLDSMGFTSGSHSQQFGMNTVLLPPSGGGSGGDYSMSMNSSSHHVGSASAASEEREGGISSTSGSLFDRIRARTAEQQKISSSNHSTQSSSNQAAAQQSSQQQYHPQLSENAFVPQQQPLPSISGEPRHQNAMSNYSNNNNNNNETTYSFSASGGAEDFSQQTSTTHNVPHIPVYGASRDHPYYIAANNANHHHHHPTNFQDKATMALAQTGETLKSLWHVGVSGAQSIGAVAKDRMMGGSGYERKYNNNFLLREEDTLEQGGGGSVAMNQSPPQLHAGTTTTTAGSASSDQALSMLQYGKTFCEDVIGFVRQLPSWGQGILGVILLWVLYVLFG